LKRGIDLTIPTVQTSASIEIRNYQNDDMPALGDLYASIKTRENTTFWWIGDEENWMNVYCAFEEDRMIAKGQVSIINIVPSGRSTESKHSIYVNLKTVPDREYDYDLLEKVYQRLFSRALLLKESLSNEFKTILCVGNDSSEIANNGFFTKQKGFHHLNSLFRMKRNLKDIIPEMSLGKDLYFTNWKMETPLEEKEYLDLEAEVWPDTPMGFERLAEYKQNPLWTAMIVREAEVVVGGLMVWREEENCGYIEDVFVRLPWRKRGIAKYMLTQALNYFKAHGLQSTYLMVLTSNNSALPLYESVGFFTEKEEIRYYIELD
jgi:ribosomal protein S18 acetylase RimI-like enzyme